MATKGARTGRGKMDDSANPYAFDYRLANANYPSIIVSLGKPSKRNLDMDADPDESVDFDDSSGGFGDEDDTALIQTTAADERPPVPVREVCSRDSKPRYFVMAFVVKNFSAAELSDENKMTSVHARLFLLQLSALLWHDPNCVEVHFERLIPESICEGERTQLDEDMYVIKQKLTMGELELNTISDEFMARDIQAYITQTFAGNSASGTSKGATCGVRCTLDILEDISPQKLCYDYIRRLSYLNRGHPKFRENQATETVYIPGIEKVHAISTREKLADELAKLSYLSRSILHHCDQNVAYAFACANIDDEDPTLPMLAVIFFYEQTIRATAKILEGTMEMNTRIIPAQLDPRNYGSAVCSIERCMGQYTRNTVGAPPVPGDQGDESDDESAAPAPAAPPKRADEYYTGSQRPKQVEPGGFSPILGVFYQDEENFVQIDKSQLPFIPALRSIWPTPREEMFMLMGIGTGLHPTVYNLPQKANEARVLRSPRVSESRAPFLNPFVVKSVSTTTSMLCSRVQPEETLQQMQDLLHAEFSIFMKRNEYALCDRDRVRLNNILCTRGFYDIWFPVMRSFNPDHGACHNEILLQGFKDGFHRQEVHKIIGEKPTEGFLKPPLAVGGVGSTDHTYQGLVYPLMAQMQTLLVTDFAEKILKSMTCHQLMMLVLLPSVYQANWPVRQDQPKNANNFLALGEHSSGKTWLFECLSERLCISTTIKNIARLTAAGLDGGDENGFTWIMDELGARQISSQGKDPIMERIKCALTSKKNGTQETAMEPSRHARYTSNNNPTGWMGASNLQPKQVDDAMMSRNLVAFPTRDMKRADGLGVADMTNLTAAEDTTTEHALKLKERFFVPLQYCMAMLSHMLSCKVLFGNYEIAYRTVKELAPMMRERWGVKLETRHEAMIFNLIRVYTSMKTIVLGLFFPAVRRRCITDAEIARASSLEEVVFILGQRTLVASQDIAFSAMGVLVPFLYEMDIDLVVCYLLTQLEDFPRSQDLNSDEMSAMFKKKSNYPISSLGVATDGGGDANTTVGDGIKRDYNYLMLAGDQAGLQEYLEHRTGMSPQQSERYMEILEKRTTSFFDRQYPCDYASAPRMGGIKTNAVVIVRPIPVSNGTAGETIDSMKKQTRVLLNVQYAQEKLNTLIRKETPAAAAEFGGHTVVTLKKKLVDYAEASIAQTEWTEMLQRICQIDFPEGHTFMTGFTYMGHPHLLHRHQATESTAPNMKISTRYQSTSANLRRMGLGVGATSETPEPSTKRACVEGTEPLSKDYKFPHAYLFWTAMEQNGVHCWVHDPEFGQDAMIVSLGHISFESLAVEEAEQGTDEAVPSHETLVFPKDYLKDSDEADAVAEGEGDGRHIPKFRVAVVDPKGTYKFFGEMCSAREKLVDT